MDSYNKLDNKIEAGKIEIIKEDQPKWRKNKTKLYRWINCTLTENPDVKLTKSIDLTTSALG